MFKKILVSFSIVVSIWVGGFCLFVTTIPDLIEDQTTHTQAIVVLTGGRERLKTGFRLLCEGMGDYIFISGVHPGESLKSILKTPEVQSVISGQDKEWLKSHTEIGYAATNTKENATETLDWVHHKSISS